MNDPTQKLTILVTGQANSGRTSVIREILQEGPGVPYQAPDYTLIYESETIDLIDARLPRPGETAEDYRKAIREETNQIPIACTWYCLNGDTPALDATDLDRIDGMGRNTLLLITHNDRMTDEQRTMLTAELERHYGAERLVLLSIPEKKGLVRLMQLTIAMTGGRFRTPTVPQDETGRVDQEADSFIHWGAGRAFAIAAVPLPLADVGPLIANEGYMIYKIGTCYGVAVNQTVLAGFIGVLGASVGGKLLASFIPFLKAPIAAAVTYGVGCAAKAYFASGMTLDGDTLRSIFTNAKSKADQMDWRNAK